MKHFNKALIVDDESLLILSIFATIHDIADIVIFAKNIGFAEDLIKQSKPDLIILDNYLSDGEGIDFLKRLKSNDEFKDIFVIFFSGSDDKIMEALTEGANLAFNKDIPMTEILNFI